MYPRIAMYPIGRVEKLSVGGRASYNVERKRAFVIDLTPLGFRAVASPVRPPSFGRSSGEYAGELKPMKKLDAWIPPEINMNSGLLACHFALTYLHASKVCSWISSRIWRSHYTERNHKYLLVSGLEDCNTPMNTFGLVLVL